ncbi:MAG: hypothetical protein COA63_001330 [Methylophaga sp.]|nr:hypothetical protein [Methylophaga sp.]
MMYNRIIAKKKRNKPFPTQEFRAKSFARELKVLLFPDEDRVNLKKQEYRKYIDALNEAMFKAEVDFSYKINGKSKTSDEFISKSRLSDWWHGKSIPEPKKQVDIEKAFPNLAAKWFDRCNFSNRFQLHLATLDLHYIDSKDSNYAHNEASSIIDKIIEDWKPKRSNRLKISGPKKRNGYDIEQHVTAEMFMPESNAAFLAECKIKAKIKYDLSLGPASYVDSLIPEGISNMYQEGNPLSIVPYMFCLLCLGADDDSNYKHDLFLDFLSVLNCAHFLVSKQAGRVTFIQNDDVGTSILKLFFLVDEYYYNDCWSYENRIKRQKHKQNIVAKKKALGIKFDPIPGAYFINNPPYVLTELFENIINSSSYGFADENELQHLRIDIPQLLKELREFYISLYKISDLTEKEVMDSLLKNFRSYGAEDESYITLYPSGKISYEEISF